MKLSNILRLYRDRLRVGLVAELLAVAGIAVGVALLFASHVASTSLDRSVAQLARGIAGNMQFQLDARSPEGFDQRLLGEVQHITGVQAALPVVERQASMTGPSGSVSIDLLGADPRFARAGGPLLKRFSHLQPANNSSHSQLTSQPSIALPAPIAQSVGAGPLQPVTLQVNGHQTQTLVGTTLSEADIGGLVHSLIALAPVSYVQRLSGMTGRLSRIFLAVKPGRERAVHAALQRLTGDGVNIRGADFDATLFSQAAGPANQSTELFAAISALVGILLALNAMLLTVPRRRGYVFDLRLDGYSRSQVVRVLLFDALVLWLISSVVGLGLGEMLSVKPFRPEAGYLSFGFPISSQRIVTWQSVALGGAVALLASGTGVFAPLREIFAPFKLESGEVQGLGGRLRTVALAGGLVCLALTTAVLLFAPRSAIVGIASLSAALLLLLPVLFDASVSAFNYLRRPFRGISPYLAVIELRDRSNYARSLAIAATGAIAVFGSVAIQGARSDLKQGLDAAVRDIDTTGQVWVTAAGAFNTFATTPFTSTALPRLDRLPGVARVSVYRGSFLNWGERRLWVLAPPSSVSSPIPASQLTSGDLATASARVRQGGWAVLSQALAAEHGLHLGSSFTLPSPRAQRMRVAGLITNLGWPPGALILNADEYARAWESSNPSAYQIQPRQGHAPASVSSEVRQALGENSGFRVETASQREHRHYASTRQALARLTEIETLVLIAATLAMTTAMGTVIWQRRAQLADMQAEGFRRGVLWRALLCESAVLLGTGCSIGALFGLYGQLLLNHALVTVTGFPVVQSVGVQVALSSFALVTAVAVLVIAIPGYLAARVHPAISFQD